MKATVFSKAVVMMAVVMYEFRKVLPIAENQVRH